MGTFGAGWSNRVNDLRTYCLALIIPPKTMRKAEFPYRDKLERIPLAFAKGYGPEAGTAVF